MLKILGGKLNLNVWGNDWTADKLKHAGTRGKIAATK